jgi:hypothetical protein
MPDPLNFQVFPVTLASSVAQLVLGQDAYRSYLAVQNTGTGALSIGFGAAPTGPGTGPSLDPASAAGGQGGSWEWIDPQPLGSIFLYSGAGTTACIIVGH